MLRTVVGGPGLQGAINHITGQRTRKNEAEVFQKFEAEEPYGRGLLPEPRTPRPFDRGGHLQEGNAPDNHDAHHRRLARQPPKKRSEEGHRGQNQDDDTERGDVVAQQVKDRNHDPTVDPTEDTPAQRNHALQVEVVILRHAHLTQYRVAVRAEVEGHIVTCRRAIVGQRRLQHILLHITRPLFGRIEGHLGTLQPCGDNQHRREELLFEIDPIQLGRGVVILETLAHTQLLNRILTHVVVGNRRVEVLVREATLVLVALARPLYPNRSLVREEGRHTIQAHVEIDKVVALGRGRIIYKVTILEVGTRGHRQLHRHTLHTLGIALHRYGKFVVVINKVDKPNCRPEEVYEMVFDLMFSLNATEDQLDFPVIYGSAKNNWMGEDWQTPTDSLTPLLDCIIKHIPAPQQLEGTPQMLITSLDYSAYTGRIAIGRVHRGTLKEGMNITLAKRNGTQVKSKIKELNTFEGLGRKKVESVSSGDICAIIGIEGFEIGDTICDFENPEPLPPIAIDEPTMSMLFTINDSPFFGKEGKYVTSRHIHDRLMKELDKNLALRVNKTENEDGKWIVSGRGVLHLSVLIETMRREGYELQVGQPQVIFKEIDGVKCEPIEELTISVPEEFASKMIDMVTRRRGEMTSMETQGDRVNIEFDMPSRGIIGLRTNVLTASQGEAIMAHRFKEYQPYKGDIDRRSNGSMIAMESGTAFAYAIDKLQDRGKFFIYPQDEVYAGQVVGEHVHEKDLVINVTKSKKLTNMRASGSDDKARIIPPVVFSLEEALEYIKADEYVEVTPKSMRMRKVILDELERKRANKE